MLGGFVDERVLDVAQVEELIVAVAALAVVADETGARAHRFTGSATWGAATWALDAGPAVVYVTDDQVAFSRLRVQSACMVCTVTTGVALGRPRRSVRWRGRREPGGGNVENGPPVRPFGSDSKRGSKLPPGADQCDRPRSRRVRLSDQNR